jgi:hypothetical protein
LRGAIATKQSSSPRKPDGFAHARNDALRSPLAVLAPAEKRTPASHARSLQLQLDAGESLRIVCEIQAAFIGLQLVVNGDESLIDHRRKAKSGRWILDDEIALIDRSGSCLDGENPLWVGLVYKISL